MTPGRNAPCPCGSGRKFKHCCGAAAAPTLPTRDDRNVAFEVLDRLMDSPRLADDMDAANELFWSGMDEEDDDLVDAIEESTAGGLMVEWTWFDYVLSTGQTLAEYALEHRAPALTPGGRRFLRACADAPLRILQVTRVEPGLVHVKDLIERGPAMAVTEHAGSDSLVKRDVLIARVADYDGVLQFEGVAVSVPALEKPELVAALRRMRAAAARELAEGAAAQRLQRMAIGLTMVACTAAMTAKGPPQMVTAEGDPMEMANTIFAVNDAAAVRAALARAKDVDEGDADENPPGVVACYDWSEDAGEGALFERRGLGSVVLRQDSLRIETMSRARAERARDRFADIAGDAISFTTIEVRSLEDVREEIRSLPPEPPIDPAIAGPIERQYMERHYREWIDQPVPALEDHTPRQATRIKRLRPMLISLVEGIESQAERMARDGRGFDTAFLRAELGLRR